jgi:hypothetical protein
MEEEEQKGKGQGVNVHLVTDATSFGRSPKLGTYFFTGTPAAMCACSTSF